MKVIAITNHKGGVGKTTSAINIGAALSILGNKVLLIDMDSQANLTMSLGESIETDKHIGTLLLNEVTMEESIIKRDDFDLIPSSLELAEYEGQIASKRFYHNFLARKLEEVKQYDYVIIDCPPSLGALTFNAFCAADKYLIPVQPEIFGFEGLKTIINFTKDVKSQANDRLECGGIFFTKYSKSYRRRLHHDVVAATETLFGEENIIPVSIRDNVSLAEAQAFRQSVFAYAPDSNGAKDYMELTQYLLSKN
jgi:chromosome partitioning protein